ncbi:MAG: hypothetical protein K2X49_20905, partial [Acetobacteraceae bacterium]|nr:hypothetical protein [Acetobacteraceae bacterium]
TADALLAPPADSLASAVHAGGPLRLYGPGTGGRPGEPAGVELQGWLRAREAGRHQVFADFAFARAGGAIAGVPCAAVLWVEERRAGAASGELGIGLGRPGTLSLTLGADLAAPGLYRFRLWLACARGGFPTPPATAEVALKAPSDPAPHGLGPDDLLHREG